MGHAEWIGGAQGLPALVVGLAVEQAGGGAEAQRPLVVTEVVPAEHRNAVGIQQAVLQEHGVDASAAGQLFPDRFEVRVEIEASGRPSAGCPGPAVAARQCRSDCPAGSAPRCADRRRRRAPPGWCRAARQVHRRSGRTRCGGHRPSTGPRDRRKPVAGTPRSQGARWTARSPGGRRPTGQAPDWGPPRSDHHSRLRWSSVDGCHEIGRHGGAELEFVKPAGVF